MKDVVRERPSTWARAWPIGLRLAGMMGTAPLPAAEADLNAPLENVDFTGQDTLHGVVER